MFSTALPTVTNPPTKARVERIEALESRITELAARINAATFEFLCLIREFDEISGWGGPGLKSCAHCPTGHPPGLAAP